MEFRTNLGPLKEVLLEKLIPDVELSAEHGRADGAPGGESVVSRELLPHLRPDRGQTAHRAHVGQQLGQPSTHGLHTPTDT